MAKHLTERDIGLVVGLIDGWDGKLTWDMLCEAAAKTLESRPTRQTLNSHRRIKAAFSSKKDLLRSGVESKRPASLDIAGQRIKRLEHENNRLKAENATLIEQFIRWQYNAYKRGITKQVLEAPMPFIDRDSSEVNR